MTARSPTDHHHRDGGRRARHRPLLPRRRIRHRGSAALVVAALILTGCSASAPTAGHSAPATSSLDDNRELGLVTGDPAVVGPLAQTQAADFAGATPFAGGPVGATTTAPPPTPQPSSAQGAAPPPVGTPCLIDPEGKCYQADEYCPAARRGQTVEGTDGPIICVDVDGWCWEPAG